MLRSLTVLVLIGLAACVSREDKMQKAFAGIDHMIGRNTALDSIPDSLATPLHDFAVAFPANPKSELYLYTATLLSERHNRFFETAKWCDDYIKLYPKGKYTVKAAMAGAFNYEKCGTYDKAIELYTYLYEKFPNQPQANDARMAANYLKLGLLTPEQQFEYARKQRDSATKAAKQP